MTFQVVLLVALIWLAIPVFGLWREERGATRTLAALLLLAILALFLAPRWYSVERVVVRAVNPNRSEAISFAIGNALSIDQKQRSGFLEPYQFAATRVTDDRLEVFENQNSLVWWKFNKQALQMELTPGVAYDLKVSGWFGLRNLIDIVQRVRETNSAVEPRSRSGVAEARDAGAPR